MCHWFLINVRECFRCSRLVNDEEMYLWFSRLYCRACMKTIENDPEYNEVLTMNYKVDLVLRERFRQIEN